MNHFIVVREDSPGKFTAYPAGLPELTVIGEDRAEAVLGAREKMNDWFLAGTLVPVSLPGHPKSSSNADSGEDSTSYMQRIYEEELERSRREDLERTLAENGNECPAISSTRNESDWEMEARAEMQRAFEETIQRSRREDLERTLAEYEAECRSTSSTPTI